MSHLLIHVAIDHWLFHPLRGLGYQFWSGIAGCLGVVGILWAYLRRHNCHAKGCPRLGRHPVEGTTYVVCRKHHPDDKPTVAHIHHRHQQHQESVAPPKPKRTTTRRKKSDAQNH